MTSEYKRSGVDLEKSDLIKDKLINNILQTHNELVINNGDGFGGLFSSNNINKNSILVSTTDSVGTKVKISAKLGLHKNLGMDIVNHCINDLIPQGARPMFFLDYLAFASLDENIVLDVIEGIGEACSNVGCAVIGGETATLPGVYNEGDYDVVGFMVGSVDKKNLKTVENSKEGDVLIALPSSGLHTNGYSLVRKIFNSDENSSNLLKKVDGEEKNLGELLAEPHREYLTTIDPVLDEINAISHITGGGLKKNLPRVYSKKLTAKINKNSWTVPPLFRHIMKEGNVSENEMFDVFNMGVGIILIVDPAKKNHILAQCENSWVIGELFPKKQNEENVQIL
ncbi:MAG: phosphoribosylformylglycinamidine cyclo-ligase [Chloroflexi bacterium]|nr:phosphoribosylformylglycinamidine cyclo-ligase [Chloroflexota bacterium]|tara:strand:+ start:579 stop:1598 length:1020 start_codon:yes stop_codon:yes gene_type:complete